MHVGVVALTASRGVVAMTDSAVIGAEAVGVLLMQRTARSTLEAGVTLGTVGNLWGQRTRARCAGDVAALTIEVGCAVMEDVS